MYISVGLSFCSFFRITTFYGIWHECFSVFYMELTFLELIKWRSGLRLFSSPHNSIGLSCFCQIKKNGNILRFFWFCSLPLLSWLFFLCLLSLAWSVWTLFSAISPQFGAFFCKCLECIGPSVSWAINTLLRTTCTYSVTYCVGPSLSAAVLRWACWPLQWVSVTALQEHMIW